MNPFLFNYLQNQANQDQQMQGQQQPMQGMQNMGMQQPMQNMPMQQPQPSPVNGGNNAPYNPFDVGIKRALESARESLGMTDKQQDKAMRRALLAFGSNMAQQPVRKGFWNNFGAVSRSVAPAISEYDKAEDQMVTENNQLANQILAYNVAQEQRAMQGEQNRLQQEERMWHRGHAENQLAEQAKYNAMNLAERARYNDMNDKWHNQTNVTNAAKASGTGAHGTKVSPEELNDAFSTVDKIIEELGEKGQRGRSQIMMDKFTPGGVQLTPEQQRINTLGETLRVKLFNAWNLKTQGEFNHIPTIDYRNSPKANLAIIKELRELSKKHMAENANAPASSVAPAAHVTNDMAAPPMQDNISAAPDIAKLVNLSNAQLQAPEVPATISTPVAREIMAQEGAPAEVEKVHPNEKIMMVDPEGYIWEVPPEGYKQALSDGFKRYNME